MTESERMYSIILGAHVSEKSSVMAEGGNQYGMKVALDATKREIKEAVEAIFDVTVLGVQVVRVKGKTKRNARGIVRKRPDWKKAYVRLQAGQELDFENIS